MSKLVVVGSINMDVVNRVDRHPLPGETIYGRGTSYIAGGKGANQAVAAARAGAEVVMVGAVGQDPFGQPLLEALGSGGVDVSCIAVKEGTSGLAFITVNGEGENHIILSSGANGLLSPENVQLVLERMEAFDAVLLQNEIPWETTLAAIDQAKTRGAAIYLNPAPARPVGAEILELIDVLIVNETEAHVLSGISVTGEADAERAAEDLLGRGAREVIITMGAAGAYCYGQDGSMLHVAAHQVEVVDTTAAGDTFIGVYASERSKGSSREEALRLANASAALAVTRHGAQSSIPTLGEVKAWLKQREK